MKTERQIEAYNVVTSNISNLVGFIDTVQAMGLSGSQARECADSLSDIDVCVYVAGELPASQIRQQMFAQLGFTNSIYSDVDFENSRGDGFLIGGVRCDFNWMSIPVIQSFLQRLQTDLDCPEYIPGGLSTVKGLYDPDKVIDGLQAAIPEYSDARAKHRISKAAKEAYFSLYDLGWLEKAAFRNDSLLFLKYEYSVLETLFRILFALNHVWLSDEKWLTSRVMRFEYVPEDIGLRVDAIVLHQRENADLNHCLSNLKGLFADTVLSIHRRYPDLVLPSDWR